MISRNEKRAELYELYMEEPVEFSRRLSVAIEKMSGFHPRSSPVSASVMVELILDMEQHCQADKTCDNETRLSVASN